MIYVDLDNTVIDSLSRNRMQIAVAARYGISESEFHAATRMAIERSGIGSYSQEAVFVACRDIHPGLSERLLAEWCELLHLVLFFPDSKAFLGALPKDELALLTTGHVTNQETKIRAHGLESCFGSILIVPSPKGHSIETPAAGSVYVDDTPRELDAMKRRHPHVFCIQVREPAFWETQRDSDIIDARCKDLQEALAVIQRLRKT